MIVNSDEARWAWMDEGITVYNVTQAGPAFLPKSYLQADLVDQIAQATGAGVNGISMRWSDWVPWSDWSIAAYRKPAAALVALHPILGEEVFNRALRTYVRDWAWKHPKPWDFFNTFERVSGQNLDWFWRGWFYERWVLDHAIASVEQDERGTRITVEDRGDLVMPAVLTVMRQDGGVEVYKVSAQAWLSGTRAAVVEVAGGSPVVRVELDEGHAYPDVDRENDVWEKEH